MQTSLIQNHPHFCFNRQRETFVHVLWIRTKFLWYSTAILFVLIPQTMTNKNLFKIMTSSCLPDKYYSIQAIYRDLHFTRILLNHFFNISRWESYILDNTSRILRISPASPLLWQCFPSSECFRKLYFAQTRSVSTYFSSYFCYWSSDTSCRNCKQGESLGICPSFNRATATQDLDQHAKDIHTLADNGLYSNILSPPYPQWNRISTHL